MTNKTELLSAPGTDPGLIAAHRCTTLVGERAGLRRRLAASVANFCALDGPARLGYASRRDYARNALGLSPVRVLRLRRVGALCLAHPVVAELSFSVIDLLAQRLPCGAAPALVPLLRDRTFKDAASIIGEAAAHLDPAPTPSSKPGLTAPDTDYQRISFAVPAQVAAYLDDTIQVASALLGQDAAEADCIDAVVAEASSEIPEGATAEEARRCFRVAAGRPAAKSRAQSPTHDPPAPRPSFRHGDRTAALILDRYIRRLLARERTIATHLEDAIHAAYESEAHRAAGYSSFVDFGRLALDMPASTLNDHLIRARLRRRQHPIAEAVAAGKLPPAKAQLIERIHRRCHVPVSCLKPWIDLAQTHSFRGLCEAVRWAHVQRNTDYRTWSTAEFPPPGRDQIRASKHPVTEIAHNPEPEILASASHAEMTSTQWVLRRATLDALLQLMAGSRAQAAAALDPPPGVRATAPPAWWCLLHVFVTARHQWSTLEHEPPGVRGQVLRRDDYPCAVPVCSQRRSLEVHHIRFRSAGGENHPHNLVTLCAFHHHALHDGRLRIRGSVGESAEDLSYDLAIDTSGRARSRFHGEEIMS